MPIALAIISTLCTLIPITISVIAGKKAGKPLRLFGVYLIIGFLTDCMKWYQYSSTGISLSLDANIETLYRLYSPLEALFFFWFISAIAMRPFLRRIARCGALLALPVWAAVWFGLPFAGLYDVLYLVPVAFLAGSVLLQYTEQHPRPMQEPVFWLLSGIFFYTFSTFAIMLLKEFEIGRQLWFLHNLINIATYLIYTAGFWQARRPSPSY